MTSYDSTAPESGHGTTSDTHLAIEKNQVILERVESPGNPDSKPANR